MERRKVEKVGDKYQVLKRNKHSIEHPLIDDWNKQGKKYTLQGLETLTREGLFKYLIPSEIICEIGKYRTLRETRKQIHEGR